MAEQVEHVAFLEQPGEVGAGGGLVGRCDDDRQRFAAAGFLDQRQVRLAAELLGGAVLQRRLAGGLQQRHVAAGHVADLGLGAQVAVRHAALLAAFRRRHAGVGQAQLQALAAIGLAVHRADIVVTAVARDEFVAVDAGLRRQDLGQRAVGAGIDRRGGGFGGRAVGDLGRFGFFAATAQRSGQQQGGKGDQGAFHGVLAYRRGAV
ncbi:hypothetical protein D3C78_1180790 [compost metagenome]